ncbi:MAG: hypothetical protein KY447_01855 [Actinobacteria bacterium]|nr:hypothetical protein [Actinomycetota bacterium]
MSPVRPLIDFLRSVATEPSEYQAFRRDPEGYLSANGYEGIHRDDATDAMLLVADTLPPAMAARLVAGDAPLDPGGDLDLERELDGVVDHGAGWQPSSAAEGDLDDRFGADDLDGLDLDDVDAPVLDEGTAFDDDPALDVVTGDDVALDESAVEGIEAEALDAHLFEDLDADPSPSAWSGPDLDVGAF